MLPVFSKWFGWIVKYVTKLYQIQAQELYTENLNVRDHLEDWRVLINTGVSSKIFFTT